MRGSLVSGCLERRPPGIIPAHAGLTPFRASTNSSARDHPRACGAHSNFPYTINVKPGSSPRMRGSLALCPVNARAEWIIPAHAGLTLVLCLNTVFEEGSSPRMRGSPFGVPEVTRVVGIIPAHAGLTSFPNRRCALWWDHPRACGAHTLL